jgi:putative N6-adenine-specific DNA methylase
MFEYQKTQRYFAQTQRRLEPLALQELEELGASDCSESYCGVYFTAAIEQLYKINYCARTISRILAPLFEFACPTEQELYNNAYHMDWSQLFPVGRTFAIDANVSNSRINHSRYAALKLKDAIVDNFRKKYGKRPNVNPDQPDVRINLNIRENRALISLDTSGDSLHRRGYRIESVAAPMQETLAAAIIRLSGWQGDKPLRDPFCGSGTLLAEALMHYCRIPSGYLRTSSIYGFFYLPEFDYGAWKEVKNDCDKNIRQCPEGLISGSDIEKYAVKASRINVNRLPGGDRITITRSDFREIDGLEDHTIITNPPYGLRLPIDAEKNNKAAKKTTQTFSDEEFKVYGELGDFLKQKCKGSTAYILCGNKEIQKHIGLKISRRFPLFNGPLDSRLVKLDVY